MSKKNKNNCKTATKITEIIAIACAFLILLLLAVIPQCFARNDLKKMVQKADDALSVVDDNEKLKEAISEMSDMLKKNSVLLHLIYSHEDVTELEEAIMTAHAVAILSPDEAGEVINSLCKIKIQGNLMLELEKLSIGKII